MPLIKSAIKKVRSDKKKTSRNKSLYSSMRSAIKKARTDLTQENIAKAYSQIDKAVKTGIIKSNTAARAKSGLVANRQKGGKSPFSKSSSGKPQVKNNTQKKKITKKTTK